MSDNRGNRTSDDAGGGRHARVGATARLSLAATPTFAVMALLTAGHGSAMPAMPGMDGPDAGGSAMLTGMPVMYMLMSVFHAGSWLRVLRRRRRGASGREG